MNTNKTGKMRCIYSREYSNRLKLKSDYLHEQAIKRLKPQAEDTILEIGCDKGDLIRKIKHDCKKVVGIDVNLGAIENCPEAVLMDATELGFNNCEFDKIISLHTIEHINELKKAFEEMDRVLKDSGIIVLAYPFELVRGMATLPSAVMIYKNPLFARQMHVHKLNHQKIEELIKGTKLHVIEKSIVFDPYPQYITVLRKE